MAKFEIFYGEVVD